MLSVIFTTGDNFCDFLFASLLDKTLSDTCRYFAPKKECVPGLLEVQKLLPVERRPNPTGKGRRGGVRGKNENNRATYSPEVSARSREVDDTFQSISNILTQTESLKTEDCPLNSETQIKSQG